MRIGRMRGGWRAGAVLVIATACTHDSLAPTPLKIPTAAEAASRLDSLYAAAAAHTTSPGFAYRAQILTYLEIAPAHGATPSPITVSTIAPGVDSIVQTWLGFEFSVQDGSAANWYFVAYSDSNVTNAILVSINNYGSSNSFLLASDTIEATTQNVFGVQGPTTVGAACAPIPGLVNPAIDQFDAGTCNLAVFNSIMVSTFVLPAGVDTSFTKINVNSTAWNGPAFVE